VKNDTADAVVKHLGTLGITHLAEWDVLTFVHLHGTSLASAEKIASLAGYTKTTVGAALESLTARGLVYRSRNSPGARLYRSASAAPDDPLRLAIEELMKVAEDRQGRLLLAKHLSRAAGGRNSRRRGGLHLA
jgi:DNA-binding IclR family transcriptional regulator